MNKRFRFGLVFAFSLVVLLSAPWLYSQQGDEKSPADKGAPEQKNAEKSLVHNFGGPCELTTCATKVLYFSNFSQPTELQDVVNTLRAIAEITRVQLLASTRVVVVRGTPEQVALAEKLVDEIDKAKRRFGGLGYRMDIKINESQGDKKLRSQAYSVLTEGREITKLSIGKQAPAQSKDEASSEKKQPQEAEAVAGRCIDVLILAENERTIDLRVDVVFSISGTMDSGKDEKAGQTGPTNPDPVQLRFRDHVTLVLGKPTVIGGLDDPNSEHSFQIEMTATRIKEK